MNGRHRAAGGRVYDYVVIGGGTAGCVLANRLSAEPDCRVLVLESGGPDWHPLLSIPLGVGMLWSRRLYDWGYDSEPQANLDGRRVELMRGRVLGGSSSINALSHVRGRPGDFDRWAANGCPGWASADVADAFRRSESWASAGISSPKPNPGPWEIRGDEGPITVVQSSSSDPLFEAWLEAAEALGFPRLDDYNLGAVEGFGRSQFAIASGRRASAARAYLRPVAHRPNLDLVTRATASRLLFEGNRVAAVEYRRGRETHTVRAAREVLLAAGAFNSPKLLMQSGIGNGDTLRRHGIDVIADLPGVGENLQDHLGVVVSYTRREPGPFRAEMRFDRLMTSMLQAWALGTGPATILPSGLHGFVRLDPSSDAPDIQFMFRGAPRDAYPWFPILRPAYEDGYSIRPVLLHPRSRGQVSLTGPGPTDPLRIDPHLLSDPSDIARLREGVRIARELGGHARLDRFRQAERKPGASVRTDADLDRFIRATAATAHHPAGTCRMGTDAGAVVAPDLRVMGIEGLRIADASVMPDLVSGNINATVVMIAERCADFILDAAPARTVDHAPVTACDETGNACAPPRRVRALSPGTPR